MDKFDQEAATEGMGKVEARALAALCLEMADAIDPQWLEKKAAPKKAPRATTWQLDVRRALEAMNPRLAKEALARAKAEGAGPDAFADAMSGRRAFSTWQMASRGAAQEDVNEMALLMDNSGVPMRAGADRDLASHQGELLPREIRANRRKALSEWAGSSWIGDAKPGAPWQEGMLALAESWLAQPPEEGGISHQDWRSAVGVDDSRNYIGENEWDVRLDMAAAFCKKFKMDLGDAGWENAISLIDMVADAGAANAVRKLLKASDEPLGASAVGAILGLAVSADDRRLMAEVALRAKAIHWRLPSQCWTIVDRCGDEDDPEVIEKWKAPLSAIHAALAAPRKVGVDGVVSGRGCFEALVAMPAMLAGAVARPCPQAFGEVQLSEVISIHERFEGLLGCDALGKNFAHYWGEDAMVDNEKGCQKFMALLKSPLWNMALAKANDGSTPVDALRESLQAGPLKKWDVAFAAWEASLLRKEAGKPAAKKKKSAARL